MRANIKNY